MLYVYLPLPLIINYSPEDQQGPLEDYAPLLFLYNPTWFSGFIQGSLPGRISEEDSSDSGTYKSP